MSDIATKRRTKVRLKPERPRLHKVILLNDDYTPREFVVTVLKGEFRMSEDQAYRVMMTAHRRGVCVVAVYTRDVAESHARNGSRPPQGLSAAIYHRAGGVTYLRGFARILRLASLRQIKDSHERDGARGFVSGR